MTKAPCVNNKDRLQVVSNFGDGDCGAGKYTHVHVKFQGVVT